MRPRANQSCSYAADNQTATYAVSPLHYRFLETVRENGSIAHALSEMAAWTGRALDDVER